VIFRIRAVPPDPGVLTLHGTSPAVPLNLLCSVAPLTYPIRCWPTETCSLCCACASCAILPYGCWTGRPGDEDRLDPLHPTRVPR